MPVCPRRDHGPRAYRCAGPSRALIRQHAPGTTVAVTAPRGGVTYLPRTVAHQATRCKEYLQT